ncbi:amino acid ABC transporter permease [Corynebacterium otitidis]|uniref:His/Glu/Gln/Arg/opine family amino ABC transporter, permease, 3-TM region n=1 Tax=Corynebacterium otitidis ATCC 51513 TaxID=883169 RepID=I7L8C0_9CORY|nr:amino acid ABC transporter permease [Corynebacterium otitidis]EJZ82980.1 His/Glu/Gln/Arg/opine family amino ABC transporter, permease, 3-TM region [Corynebacterium otitidis ATCC 51513]CCI83142.1 putative amino-acid ABC transporter permease protein patM [Corynebacterium otitidis ATCC 51513]
MFLGVDLGVVAENIQLYGKAALLTVGIGVTGTVIALVVGAACAFVQYFRVPVAGQLAAGYIELSRNTPLLVQLVFLYYGLPRLGIVLSGTQCAIIGLAFLGGSYMAESLRSGLEDVPAIQRQSALALGLSTPQAFGRVLLPQAVATAMPGLTANVIFLIKETSVVSVIAVPDLVYRANEQIGNDYTTREALVLLVGFYLLILVPVALVGRWLEGRTRRVAA